MPTTIHNPHQYQPRYIRINDPRFAGGHNYAPVVGFPLRKRFRRASEAESYAKRHYARWCRLYDAALVAMMNPSPAGTEEGQSAVTAEQ